MSALDDAKPLLDKFKNRLPLPPLIPDKIWDVDLNKEVDALKIKGTTRAVLHLWNDDLEVAHSLAQEINNATGSLIHGIMHRRQPDYSNSKYWFRRVGNHPIFINLIQEFPGWDPIRFIDLCQKASESKDLQAANELEWVQMRELELLTYYCLEMES